MTRIKQAAAHGMGLLASTASLGLCVTGCTKTYLAPSLPANQLARVKFDSITRDMKVVSGAARAEKRADEPTPDP